MSLFVIVLIGINVNIRNELIFSDVRRSLNYTGSLSKFVRGVIIVVFFHFDKPKIKIRSLIYRYTS